MSVARMLGVTLLLGLAPAAAAHAATIRTDAGTVFYAATATDQISMGVDIGPDPELGANTIFFRPVANTPPHTPPQTTDANCRASGTPRCASRALIDIQGGDRDDFVRVLQGGGTVTFRGGNGADHLVSDSPSVQLSLHGQAGNDWMQANPARAAIETVDGGPGNDLLDPGLNDAVNGGPDVDTVRMPYPGGQAVTLDDQANDGRPGEHFDIGSDVENVIGGPDGDQIDGSSGPNTLDGAGGNDTLNGLAGADTLIARDGAADSVSCGPGDDRAIVDPLDAVSPDCETVDYPDNDQDGFGAGTDCNDANAAIHPGAVDVAGNGVDEDCSGADAPVLGGTAPVDADRDGTSPPVDCNDASAGIHPGAADTPGDGVDQDCSGADAKLKRVGARITDRWTVTDTRARIDRLTIRGIPKGGKVIVACKGGGCPFKRHTVKVKAGKANAGRLFRGRQLHKGATVQVTITAPGFIGKVVRYTFEGRRKVPSGKQLCLPPGARSPKSCG
jgi:Ca2+-binding RTX toxin-like protein